MRPLPRLTLIAALMLVTARNARAYHDAWTGPDKRAHLEMSAVLAAGGYVAATLFDGDLTSRLLTGAAVAGAAGLTKEAVDLAGYGDPSGKDLAWDGLGLSLGLATSFAIDALVSWLLEPPRPLASNNAQP